MNEFIISKDKLLELKGELIYFHHYFELNALDKSNTNYIPDAYKFFFKENNRSLESFTYFNTYYIILLSSLEEEIDEILEEKRIDGIIIDTLTSLSNENLNDIFQLISSKNNFWNCLLDRSHATYTVDFNRETKSKFSQTLLNIYQMSYENTEILFVLCWISESLAGQTLSTDFNDYKDGYGNILKGKLVNRILETLNNQSGHENFRKIIKKAYYSKLRHLTAHNSAKLDEDKEMIISIDKPNVKISYEKALQSLYILQQLQNHVKMFLNNLFIEQDKLINEGMVAIVFVNPDKESECLCLVQLEPFFDKDIACNKEITNISVIIKDGYYIFSSEKELLRVPQTKKLSNWYQREAKITIASARPNTYQDDDTIPTLDTEYGSYVFVADYIVDNINYS